MRKFTNEGPVVPRKHYCIPPVERMDLDRVLELIHDEKYFILHAPRQTGKTSALIALQDLLNSGSVGSYRCVYVNVEGGQTAKHDVGRGIRSVLFQIALRAQLALQDDFVDDTWLDVLEKAGPDAALTGVLTKWCLASSQPLVLLLDEIDALIGDTLISVLRQLRAGYDTRPAAYPQSVVLCGVRDVRDYRIHSAKGEPVTGGSAFNISAASLRLGDFERAEVEALVGQHTAETGQQFEPAALERVWAQTQGQPWLVNALCSKACFESPQGRDRSRAITDDDILEAQEILIQGRAVHLDQLAAKLREKRVQRVIEPILSGTTLRQTYVDQDLEYVRDLGLVALDAPTRIANPIYAEVVPRQLTYAIQEDMVVEPAWYIDDDGALNLDKLLEAFQQFFRENSEHWLQQFEYEEAGPQLLLQAFLQRVLNGGGRIVREAGLGRQRVDILIRWPRPQGPQRFVIECKILRGTLKATLADGLPQTAGYMDRCGADAGHLVIFDRSAKPWEEKIFRRSEGFEGTSVEVWGM